MCSYAASLFAFVCLSDGNDMSSGFVRSRKRVGVRTLSVTSRSACNMHNMISVVVIVVLSRIIIIVTTIIIIIK